MYLLRQYLNGKGLAQELAQVVARLTWAFVLTLFTFICIAAVHI